MKLLLQSDWQADNMTAPVKQAIQQFAWKGQDVWKKEVGLWLVQKENELLGYEDYTPIGTVEFVKAFAKRIGIKLPDPIHATELLKLEGRLYTIVENKDLIHKSTYPFFVKPFKELKKFTGFVARSDKDFELYPDVDWANTSLFLTGVLKNIVSEWRCYVLNGKVFACVNYAGDPLKFPNEREILRMIDYFKPQPISFSLDIALCKNGGNGNNYTTTRFIEINDAYALGYYGGNVELYTKMLDLRWKEIINLSK
jgi:hypothetical protein